VHQTVQRTFVAFQDNYLPHERKLKVLEIGSQNFNGGLRDLKKDNLNWFGVDIEAGPGVDQVVKIGDRLPFEDESFDLVVASSVFEHDIQFWSTFLEMARTTKPDGILLLIMPSQGTFHRYPLDAFRFYPDAGIALEKWAQSHGLPIRLVESFTTRPEGDVWADYVAVFSPFPSQYKDKLLGKALEGENWNIMGELQLGTFQESPYELRKIEELMLGRQKLVSQLENQSKELIEIRNSISWKLTSPLRHGNFLIRNLVRGLSSKGR
jgi:SAM-dependent methyltransferase